ncbi:MAG: hypothetical protein ACFCUG_11715 [Thiotrichales bacterium]
MNDTTEDLGTRLELAQALARFKLQVRRKLNQSIDLESMRNDLQYARQRLAEIEDLAEDEELLVAVVMLRERLFPSSVADSAAQPAPKSTSDKYKFGARG